MGMKPPLDGDTKPGVIGTVTNQMAVKQHSGVDSKTVTQPKEGPVKSVPGTVTTSGK